jgi:hypothetical protein
MSDRQRQGITILLLGITLAVPCARAAEAKGLGGAARAAAASGWQPLAGLWQAVVRFWEPAGATAGSRPAHSRGRRGGGPLPQCDSGTSLDPSGHCVGNARHATPIFRHVPTCETGTSLDPDGKCHS